MPCLLYLPSLTEEAESLRVLEAAYRALISLAMVRFANEEQRRFRTKSLDRIFHHGIMKGYAHAGEHVKIAELLVNQIADLTNKMGIGCAKQLKVLDWPYEFGAPLKLL